MKNESCLNLSGGEKWTQIVRHNFLSLSLWSYIISGRPGDLTVARYSCIPCAVSVAWMLDASRGVATTCVTRENAADATRYAIDISFFSTVRAPDLDYYSRVGPRNVKAADNYVGLRHRSNEVQWLKMKKNAVNPSSLSLTKLCWRLITVITKK